MTNRLFQFRYISPGPLPLLSGRLAGKPEPRTLTWTYQLDRSSVHHSWPRHHKPLSALMPINSTLSLQQTIDSFLAKDPNNIYATLAPPSGNGNLIDLSWREFIRAVHRGAHAINPLVNGKPRIRAGNVIAIYAVTDTLLYATLILAIIRSGNIVSLDFLRSQSTLKFRIAASACLSSKSSTFRRKFNHKDPLSLSHSRCWLYNRRGGKRPTTISKHRKL